MKVVYSNLIQVENVLVLLRVCWL